ncbi:MAG: hypothetical protein KIT73_05590 [Burkholderiales bacterium]|nr:hypothetical protein [Burkholderiales bacterium]
MDKSPRKTPKKERRKMAQLDFEPALTDAQVDAVEASYNASWGVRRRVMQQVLLKSKAELVEAFSKGEEGEDAAVFATEMIREYKEHLEAGIDLAESALARLTVAGLCVIEKVSS